MPTMTYDYFTTLINDPAALTAFHKSIIAGSVERHDINEFFYYTASSIDTWQNILTSGEKSISEKYYSAVMPIRLFSAVLISLVNQDRAYLAIGRVAPAMAALLKVCADVGLNYMEEEDLHQTINAFNAAKVWLFVERHGHLCKSFTDFIHANWAVFDPESED